MTAPDHLFGPPALPGADKVLTAFMELSTDRAGGMGLMPIPYSAIDRYADRYGYTAPDRFELFRRAIRAMDGIYLEWAAKKTETKVETK